MSDQLEESLEKQEKLILKKYQNEYEEMVKPHPSDNAVPCTLHGTDDEICTFCLTRVFLQCECKFEDYVSGIAQCQNTHKWRVDENNKKIGCFSRTSKGVSGVESFKSNIQKCLDINNNREKCSTCLEPVVTICDRRSRDSTCKNGHQWHYDKNNKRVDGMCPDGSDINSPKIDNELVFESL